MFKSVIPKMKSFLLQQVGIEAAFLHVPATIMLALPIIISFLLYSWTIISDLAHLRPVSSHDSLSNRISTVWSRVFSFFEIVLLYRFTFVEGMPFCPIWKIFLFYHFVFFFFQFFEVLFGFFFFFELVSYRFVVIVGVETALIWNEF